MYLKVNLSDADDVRDALVLLTFHSRGEHADGAATVNADMARDLKHIPDNTDPAQVFAPLGPGGAPLGAGAAVSASAPEAPQAGAAPSLPEYSPAAAAALPPVSAPAASAPAASPAPGVDVDATGLPWDARIHSTPAKKNADNTWRAKRGLNDGALVASVQAELRQVMAIPGGAPAAPAPAPATAPIVPAAPVAPPPPAPQPPAANGHLPDPTTGAELLPRVTAAQLAGALPPTALLEACTQMGLPSIPMLFTRPDLVPAIWLFLKATHPALG
jgi:hypothetical protein